MKKIIVMLIALILASCNGKDTAMDEFTGPGSQLTKGQWHIKAFMKDGRQTDTDYAAFIFTFTADGHIIANDGSHNYKGKWSVIREDETDDEPTDTYFVISFKQPEALAFLNREWIATEKKPSYLNLSLSNNDSLVFEKI